MCPCSTSGLRYKCYLSSQCYFMLEGSCSACRGLPVVLELVANVQAACSKDGLSSSPSDTFKSTLGAEPGLSEGLQTETRWEVSQGKHTCTKLESSRYLPFSSLVSPFRNPLALLAWRCPHPCSSRLGPSGTLVAKSLVGRLARMPGSGRPPEGLSLAF